MTAEVIQKTVKHSKRVGRGASSGKGKTSGRGMNGQKSRTGSSTKFFEGGQTKLVMRLPKVKGFKSRTQEKVVSLTVNKLVSKFKPGSQINLETVAKTLDISYDEKVTKYVKIIGVAKEKLDFKFDADIRFSKSLQKSLNK